MACLPNFEQIGLLAPMLFFVMQMTQSFSFGGENSTSSVYLMENVPQNEQALTGALLWGSSLLAVALSVSIVYGLKLCLSAEQMINFGWRIPLIIGLTSIIYSFWFRIRLIEPRTRQAKSSIKVEWLPAIKVLLVMAPSSLLFYINSVLNATFIHNITSEETLQSILPIVFNLVFFVATMMAGYFIDKYSHSRVALTRSYALMALLSVPIYGLQDLGFWWSILLAQLLITLFIAICLSSTPAVMTHLAGDNNKILNFGIGCNIGGIVFGGCAPLMLHFLSQYGQSYIGLLMSFGGMCYFLALALDKGSRNLQTTQA